MHVIRLSVARFKATSIDNILLRECRGTSRSVDIETGPEPDDKATRIYAFRVIRMETKIYSYSWWLGFNLKKMLVKLDDFPKDWGENKKNETTTYLRILHAEPNQICEVESITKMWFNPP